MTAPPPPSHAPWWPQLRDAGVRGFHRYATWLVSLTWKRFIWYSLLLLLLAVLVQQLPPFSWSYTETVVDHTLPRPRPRPASAPASAASAAPAASAASAPPTVRVTRRPASAGGGKDVDITIPGVVLDSEDKSIRAGDVVIRFEPQGIHITSDDRHAPAAASAASAVGSPPGPDAAASDAVDIEADGRHVRISVPANARSGEVREAVAAAREEIVHQIRASAERQRAAERAAARAEAKARAADREDDAQDSDDDGDGDTRISVSADGQRSVVRTRTVHYGDGLTTLALWWILGSVLLKITYKGRMQAEVKAAAATETAEAESLRRQVLEARMAIMQAQVEPHFLFNTLASIDHLIEFDPRRASQMQRNLISLLRASMPSMRASDSGLRPLARELAVVRPYLEILKVRMEERLTTEIDVPEGLLSAEFPPMMIQTLVENAIKHGLEPKPEGGHLAVKAEIRHGKLCVTVSDTGLGLEAAAKGGTQGTGVGLANIRERLSLLYGGRASLVLTQHPAGGTVVTITVPYTTHEEAPET